MTRTTITTVSLLVSGIVLAACNQSSTPAMNVDSAYSAGVSTISFGASLTPYVSPNEPVWPSGMATPDSVPTPPGISEEIEDDEEEVEENPAAEKCHTIADACFSAESEEVACLKVLVTCLNEADATEVGACIQAEVDCLQSGVDATTCGNQADTCLEDLE